MKQILLVTILLLMAYSDCSAANRPTTASQLKQDQNLVFFDTSAWFDPHTKQWHIPIHGWVFEPAISVVRKEMIAKSMHVLYGLSTQPSTQDKFDQRINLLLADNKRNRSIVIRFAERSYTITKSQPNGHFSDTLKVDAEIIKRAMGPTKQLHYQAVLPNNDSRVFSGKVNLLQPEGLSIISDIDDTIKISQVNNRKLLLESTFYKDFTVVPGIAEKYQQWLPDNGGLHFVTSSPWQLYPALHEFIERTGFPAADYAMKLFRFKDRTLFNLFVESTQTKPPQIIQILQRYPARQFILVGDSGEHDPEIYAQIQQQFPAQILKILIRNVSNEDRQNKRFRQTFKGIEGDLWQLFNHVDEIELELP